MPSVIGMLRRLAADARARGLLLQSQLRGRTEAERAVAYWAGLPDYHETNDEDPMSLARSRWLATELVPELGITSVLEVGTNSGRNLGAIRAAHPELPLRGTDVNPRAVEYARSRHPDVDFQLQDANRWVEPDNAWDAILTMSVLDHIPDQTIEAVAANFVRTAARYVIAVELWDGSNGTRGPYKYSRDTRALFERHGARTLRWEVAPSQYDVEHSLLWVYVGAVDGA
jgi:SAM-dependent methyltransferase